MSIIEKAVDKLIGNEPSAKKPGKQRAGVPAQSQDNKPDKKPKKQVAQQKTDSSLLPADTSSTDEPSIKPVIKPDISLQDLKLDGVISSQSKRTRLAEEMRMIKRPILLSAFRKENRRSDHSNLAMITSAVAGEGKTFTALNLALSIAMEMDRTVLLVDADLARPGLSRLLRKNEEPGLTDYLLDEEKDLSKLMLRTDVPKLAMLPAGRQHLHSTELLASNNMKCLFNELAVRYTDRIVLFDTPPLLVTSEAGVLAGFMGQIALVVESASTPQYLVKEALAQLDSTDNVSLILNKCKKSFLSARMAGYGYGYGYDEEHGSEGDQ